MGKKVKAFFKAFIRKRREERRGKKVLIKEMVGKKDLKKASVEKSTSTLTARQGRYILNRSDFFHFFNISSNTY